MFFDKFLHRRNTFGKDRQCKKYNCSRGQLVWLYMTPRIGYTVLVLFVLTRIIVHTTWYIVLLNNWLILIHLIKCSVVINTMKRLGWRFLYFLYHGINRIILNFHIENKICLDVVHLQMKISYILLIKAVFPLVDGQLINSLLKNLQNQSENLSSNFLNFDNFDS
jgi:hypothetical protein